MSRVNKILTAMKFDIPVRLDQVAAGSKLSLKDIQEIMPHLVRGGLVEDLTGGRYTKSKKVKSKQRSLL